MSSPTHKLAAIMFTDIAGYTSLAAHDEERALELIELQRELLQPIVTEFNGEWLKEIGDGLLLSFPSSKQAVNCAIKIQKTLRNVENLNLRIGIHQGDILEKGGDVFGDDVNIASRIEAFSAIGGVAITHKVHGDISGSPEFSTKYIGEPELKGVKQTVRIYCITSHELPETEISEVSAKLGSTLPTPLQQVIASQTTHPELGKKFPWRTILVTVVGLFILSVGIFYLKTQVPLGEPIPVAVISFENQTGDEAFDYLRVAIPNLLITSLEQSKYLRVTTWERMRDLLKQVGEKNVEIIDKELGFELCRREGIKTIVLGSFIKAGNTFATDVKVLDVTTKKILKSASSSGEGVASILKNQIDQLSKEISRGIGIPKRKIELSQRPIREVTTTSMEAYNYFLRGKEEGNKFYLDDARRFLEKAIELDSTFAMAYLYLAYVYRGLGNTEAMNETFTLAKVFSEKTTEKERLSIESAYVLFVERDQGKALLLLKQMLKKYPKEKEVHHQLGHYFRDKKSYNKAMEAFKNTLELDPNYAAVYNDLAYTYADIGNLEKAIEYLEKYASLSPGDANPFDSMGEIYFRMGKFDQAIAKYKEALEVKPDFYTSNLPLAYIYALKEDYHETIEWVGRFISAAPSPGLKAEGYLVRGVYNF